MLTIMTVAALSVIARHCSWYGRSDAAPKEQTKCKKGIRSRLRRRIGIAFCALIVICLVENAFAFIAKTPKSGDRVDPATTVGSDGQHFAGASKNRDVDCVESLTSDNPQRGELDMLLVGQKWLETQTGYSGTFLRQECVDDQHSSAEEMQIVLQHTPFAVRLDWLESGQRVSYVDGENDNLLLVRLGGPRRLLGTLRIDPLGERAMQGSRHPITEIGLLNLTKRVISQCQRDAEKNAAVVCTSLPDDLVDNRPCAVFLTRYPTPAINPDYSSSLVCVDREWKVPVRIRMTGWADLQDGSAAPDDESIEFYEYRDVKFLSEINASSFDLTRQIADAR